MFYPMQAAAAKALSLGDDWYRSVNKLYGSREAKAYEILNQIGCSYDAGQAGLFVWGRLPEGAGDCYEFSDKILNGCGVFLTPGGIFGSEGNRYVRISLCATGKSCCSVRSIKSRHCYEGGGNRYRVDRGIVRTDPER